MAEAGMLQNPNPSPATFPTRILFKSAENFLRLRRSVLTIPQCSSQSSPSKVQGSQIYALISLMKRGLGEVLRGVEVASRNKECIGIIWLCSRTAKPLWKGEEQWTECLELLRIAEEAAALDELTDKGKKTDGFIVRRRGILRPAMSAKNFDVLNENARNCLPNCKIQTIDQNAADNLLPNISTPCNAAFYLPEAVNINPQLYVQALFLACQNLAHGASSMSSGKKEFYLHKSCINKLIDLASEYTAVVICLGAKADLLPELSGRLPLRTCRGVITHLQLPVAARDGNIGESPSILSDVWLAVQNSHSLYMGATWDWKSKNHSRDVSSEEAASALEELLPKASAIYPSIKNWEFNGAFAGVRAMPPLTAKNGSLPLLGCIDNLVTGNGNHGTKFWLFGGLGSRGLLYHALLGKITAKAVLGCDENLIPFELLSWNKSNTVNFRC